MEEKKILYKLTVQFTKNQSETYFVIATDETAAANKVHEMHREWNYEFDHVSTVERIAESGKYGSPKVLLIV